MLQLNSWDREIISEDEMMEMLQQTNGLHSLTFAIDHLSQNLADMISSTSRKLRRLLIKYNTR